MQSLARMGKIQIKEGDVTEPVTDSTNDLCAPDSLSAPGSTFDGVSLSWDTVDGPTVYRMEYRELGEDDWVAGDEVEEPDPVPARINHTQGGLDCDRVYELRVRSGSGAAGSRVWGEASEAVGKRTDNLCIPTGLEAAGQTDRVALGWDAVTGANAYLVQHREPGTDRWGPETTVAGGATTHTVRGLMCNTEYEFQVTSARVSQKGVVARGGSATITRGTAQCPPVMTTARDASQVVESNNANFTVTADRAPASALVVEVTVNQDGDFTSQATPYTAMVTIAANSTEGSLTVEIDNDEVDEDNGSVTVTILTRTPTTALPPTGWATRPRPR